MKDKDILKKEKKDYIDSDKLFAVFSIGMLIFALIYLYLQKYVV